MCSCARGASAPLLDRRRLPYRQRGGFCRRPCGGRRAGGGRPDRVRQARRDVLRDAVGAHLGPRPARSAGASRPGLCAAYGGVPGAGPEKMRRERHPDRRQFRLGQRSEEHTSELQSLMRISYAVFCLKKKKYKNTYSTHTYTSITTNKLTQTQRSTITRTP